MWKDKRWNDKKEITKEYKWNVPLIQDFAHKIENWVIGRYN